MREVFGNLWDWYDAGAWVVVPCNVGWKRNGENVMGRGVAKQAKDRFALKGINLPLAVGTVFREAVRAGLPLTVFCAPEWRVIYFPTKPLNYVQPHLSWRNNATLGMIEASAWGLASYPTKILLDTTTPIALPLVGTGCGGLREEDVLPILRKHLVSDQFVLVRPGAGT